MNTPSPSKHTSDIGDALSSAKDTLNEVSDNAAKVLKQAASTADGFVRENPWIAIGVAAGVAAAVGFLAGQLSAPRKRFF